LPELRWQIEGDLRWFARHTGLELDFERAGLLVLTRALRNGDFIGPKLSALLDDLRSISNHAMHSGDTEFTTEEALRYWALYERVSKELMAAIPVGPDPNFQAEVK
jgi:hypothetical protein